MKKLNYSCIPLVGYCKFILRNRTYDADIHSNCRLWIFPIILGKLLNLFHAFFTYNNAHMFYIPLKDFIKITDDAN